MRACIDANTLTILLTLTSVARVLLVLYENIQIGPRLMLQNHSMMHAYYANFVSFWNIYVPNLVEVANLILSNINWDCIAMRLCVTTRAYFR